MKEYNAIQIYVPKDDQLEYGEGDITFLWSDPIYGTEGLNIDLDGFCSRKMPIRSGQGPPEFVELDRNHLRLRFDPKLAKKLELEEEIEIHFEVCDWDYEQLCKFLASLKYPN